MLVQPKCLLSFLLTATALFPQALGNPRLPGLTKRQYDPAACNNHPSLCTRKYSEIYHLGAHDSPFIRNPDNGYSVAGNQYFNVRTQLEGGVRLLQGQVYKEGGKPRLCHTDCRLMDGGSLEDYLAEVKHWMDGHPSDVVTMLWVNGDRMPAKDLDKYFTASGLKGLAFIPSQRPLTPTEWPTLRDMIEAGKRLVLFLSNSADESKVPYILDEFSYLFETPFENFDPAKFTCDPHRPTFLEGPDKLKEAAQTRIGAQNRFLYDRKFEKFGLQIYTPDPQMSLKINSGDTAVAGNLRTGIEKCKCEWERAGGFVLVDFFNEGNPIAVVDAANGFSDPRNRVNPPESYVGASEELWKGTKSAGEMSLPLDDLQELGDELSEQVDDVKDKIGGGVETVKTGGTFGNAVKEALRKIGLLWKA